MEKCKCGAGTIVFGQNCGKKKIAELYNKVSRIFNIAKKEDEENAFLVWIDAEYRYTNAEQLFDDMQPYLHYADIRFMSEDYRISRFAYRPGWKKWIAEKAEIVFPSNLDGASDTLLRKATEKYLPNHLNTAREFLAEAHMKEEWK